MIIGLESFKYYNRVMLWSLVCGGASASRDFRFINKFHSLHSTQIKSMPGPLWADLFAEDVRVRLHLSHFKQ